MRTWELLTWEEDVTAVFKHGGPAWWAPKITTSSLWARLAPRSCFFEVTNLKRLSHLLTFKFKRFYIVFKKLYPCSSRKRERSGPQAGPPSSQAATRGNPGAVSRSPGHKPAVCSSPHHSRQGPRAEASGSCILLCALLLFLFHFPPGCLGQLNL